MWQYEKQLQYPVKIRTPNPRLAKLVITQFGGPDGELGASLRYLSTEELGHMEMICAMVHQLTRNLTEQQIIDGGFAPYFTDHTVGVYPVDASGVPYAAATFASKGDIITDLHEDMAAEQKARTTYDNLLRLSDDADVTDVLRFLREREIVHYQRFGEGLVRTTERLNSRNYYACNPSFDKNCPCKSREDSNCTE